MPSPRCPVCPTEVADAEPEDGPEPATEEIRPSEREFWLLRFVLASDDHTDWLVTSLDPQWIGHTIIREIISRRCGAHAKQAWRGIPGLLQECDSSYAQQLITRAVAEQIESEKVFRNLAETVLRVRNDYIERELKVLTQRRAQPGISDEEGIEIEKRKAELRRLKSQPIEADFVGEA